MPRAHLAIATQQSSTVHHRGVSTVIAAIIPAAAQPPAMPALAPHTLPATEPSRASRTAAKVTVSAYRLLGFAILTLIVVVLLGYIAQTTFYLFSHTWAMPVQISPSDDKVVALQTQLAAQKNARDTLVAELAQAELAVAAEQKFQGDFIKAVQTDLANRKAELAKVSSLAGTARAAGGAIAATNAAFASSSRKKMKKEYDAGLIDRSAMLAGNFQDATISSSTIGLAERAAVLDQRANDLATQTASLDAILADKASSEALSYDVLKIKRDYDNSKLALANDTAQRDAIKAAIARQDEVIASLEGSAFLRALTDKATVAFVPYGNLDGVEPGRKMYRCSLGMVWCHEVGVVLAVLPGEVQFKHPHRDKMVRGQMVELRFEPGEDAAAQDDVLFIGGKPLGL